MPEWAKANHDWMKCICSLKKNESFLLEITFLIKILTWKKYIKGHILMSDKLFTTIFVLGERINKFQTFRHHKFWNYLKTTLIVFKFVIKTLLIVNKVFWFEWSNFRSFWKFISLFCHQFIIIINFDLFSGSDEFCRILLSIWHPSISFSSAFFFNCFLSFNFSSECWQRQSAPVFQHQNHTLI